MLFLPTGDGICVCLVDLIHPFDLDISIAISVLERVSLFNRNQVDPSRDLSFVLALMKTMIIL